MGALARWMEGRPKGRVPLFFVGGLLLVMFCASAAVSETRVLRVAPGGRGDKSGSSWENALDEAGFAAELRIAGPGTEFWVAKGSYRPSLDPAASTDAFVLRSGVSLYGGFAGAETAREDRNWTDNVTVLTGDLEGNDTKDSNGIVQPNGIQGTNSRNVVRGEGCDVSAILDGFSVTGGDASTRGYKKGGALYLIRSNPTIRNCAFVGNQADDGAGVCLEHSAALFEACVFSQNKTKGSYGTSGGGMYNFKSTPRLVRCSFLKNQAHQGGGVFNTDSRPIFEDCVFSENIAEKMGGGMYNGNTSNALLTRCRFIENKSWTASWGLSPGGGMYNASSSPSVRDCLFEGNKSKGNGGGMYNLNSSRPVVTNCAFRENTAENGGGICNDKNNESIERTDLSALVTNCTFWGNAANKEGAGMFNLSGNVFVTHCTFWGHRSVDKPVFISKSSAVSVFNCIFWNEESGVEIEHRSVFQPGGKTRISHCVVRGGLASGDVESSDIIDAEPGLNVPADNGGFTPTCALGAESPARDAGAPRDQMEHLQSLSLEAMRREVLAALRRDQRGFSRLDGKPDVGAYEWNPSQSGEVFFIVASADANGTVEPNGEVVIRKGDAQRFVVKAEDGFRIAEIRVDEKLVPVVGSLKEYVHTFPSVDRDHEIRAAFEEIAFSGLRSLEGTSPQVRIGSSHTFGFELDGAPDTGFGVIRDVFVEYRTRSGAIGRQYAWWTELPVRSRNISLVFKPLEGLEDGVLTLSVELRNGTILAAALPVTVVSEGPRPGPSPNPSPSPSPQPPSDSKPGPLPRPESEDEGVFIPRKPADWSVAFYGSGEPGISTVELSADVRFAEPPSMVHAGTANFVNGIESWSLHNLERRSGGETSEGMALALRPYRLYRLKLTGRVRDVERKQASIQRLVFGFKDGSQVVRDFPDGGLKTGDVLQERTPAAENGRAGGCGILAWGALSLIIPLKSIRGRRRDGKPS